MKKKVTFLVFSYLALAMLTGCSTPSNGRLAPVDTLSSGNIVARPHTVKTGETLYTIAAKYGWDYRDLASLNHIRSPYRVYVGQIIRFKREQGNKTNISNSSKITKRISPPLKGKEIVGSVKEQQIPSYNPEKENIIYSATMGSKIDWHWPTKGKLLSKFSPDQTAQKGIDIAGEIGAPICAARDGKVVYSGSGLRGYGQLIIIKHDDKYLSAYAHNHRLFVKEGYEVKVGDKIAEMGDSGADRVKLHFEIRHQGKPVDPLKYLPQLREDG